MEDPQEVRVTGFIIHATGDSSVGIPDSSWSINGDFYFDSPDDLKDFKEKLCDLFCYVCDSKPRAATFEEHQAFLDAEDALMAKHHDPKE